MVSGRTARATPGSGGGITTRRLAFPYQRLVEENARRSRDEPEFELLDTGVFDDNRYWSVDVTYAKSSPTEVLARITIENHGPDEATLSVLPTVWFRNTWRVSGEPPPSLSLDGEGIVAEHPRLAGYRLDAAPTADGVEPVAVFCDNETNTGRVFGSAPLTALSQGRDQRSRCFRRIDGQP